LIYSKNIIRKWELWGIAWIIIVGTLLHFTFEWSGNSKIVALFSPVNESVWEHLKMSYWAVTTFMIIEHWFIKPYTHSFFLSKFLGILAMNLFIVIVFYIYTSFMDESLIINIVSFMLGAVICQLIGIKIMNSRFSPAIEKLGLVMYLLMGMIFVVFTFYPPHIDLFMDSNSKTYGISIK
jgi:hypothetical protein